MCEVNPDYKPYVQYDNGNKVLYVKVLREIYGCIESSLLWYNFYVKTLKYLGFSINTCDICVANKMIDGKKCTILWYVEDNKMLHVDPNVDDVKAYLFHLLTAKLLYITNRTRPDIEPAVALLTTRVAKINVDDWKKLRRCTSYMNQMSDDVRIIGGFNITDLFTWVDASYPVHTNMHIQTEEVMSMGYVMLHCQSSKQNLNAKITTHMGRI